MEQQRVEKSLFLLATQILLLASVYFAGGKAGLNAPYLGSSITLFWPPSGIALAALLLWGLPCWPGIFLGALVTNLATGDLTSHVALAIAIGNTAGPVLGALLLRKVMGFQNSFIRGRDVTTFLLIGPGSMLLTASIGVFALYAGGMLPFDVLSRAWVGWWLGDTVGVLVFTPFLLFLMNLRRTQVSPSQIKLEFIVVLGSCVCLTWLIFGGITAISQLMLPLAFLVFPPLIWAGLRLNALETFIVVLAIASIAVMGTAKGFGPFSGGDFQLDQLVLCVFVATITLIAFMMIGIQANQRQAEQQLQDSESRLRLALAAANQGLYDLNVQTGEAIVSPEYARMLGYDPQSFVETDRRWLERTHPADRDAAYQVYSDYIGGLREDYRVEFRQLTQQGEWKWILSLGKIVAWNQQGQPLRMLGTHTDISEQKRAEEELSTALEELKVSERHQRELRVLAEREQSRMGALLSAMNMGILFEDNEHRVEYVNPAFLRMWGIGEHENLLNKPARTILESSSERFAQPSHASKHVLNVLDTHEISERCELELNNGRTLTQLSYPVNDIEGRIIGRLWIYEDITQERQTAQQLLYLAERDPLTGLYNRHRFQEELNNLIATALRNRQKFALLYFDLDDFKYINDTFGHKAGDTVLVRTAGEISSIVRHIEVLARLGGDEFAILSHLQPDDDLSILPARIVTSISSIPLHFRDTNIRLTTSVGVAVFPEHGETAEDLVAHADAAMYQAKNKGKNTWAVYDPQRDSSEAMMHRLTWYNRIAQALEQNLFEVHFQGVYETAHNALTHLEILVRMRDVNEPAHLIMPGQFIPIAEKNGQIVTIDRWVIKRSIELLSENPDMPPVAINISGRTFDDPAIPQYIRNLLSELRVDPGRLIIELTETAAVSDIQDAQRFIEAVHQAGCCVCLDDFGSGFSTFGYLKYLGVEILKIDGLFIRDLPNNRDNQIFVKAMVEVARGLGKLTVAEFVEDAATLSMVKNLGVDLAQGYYFGRPSAQIPVKS
ncbi:EAL domain-containing protein [Nitrosomonas sp. Is24]|uniref:bifunctional diguanylate cyclase/phosphodiesterase n=1 Tax=Nitrosomonas sp. Is24 TaxID=3080533 RepID=UPI00294ABDA7|nr:EAL domain-containing protein [Nitrosomonas sp. Is24]MDV6342824.1 EAL domain-containing protein [Nitrosomonas sp. Is24]